MSSTALNVFHKVLATGLMGATGFGFYVFGEMGYGVVQRRNARLKQMEQEKPKFDLDELPMPTSENNGK